MDGNRTNYSEFPEAVQRLFANTADSTDIDALMQVYKDAIVVLGYENDGNNCSEVYDMFPENPKISIGDIEQSKNPSGDILPYYERKIQIDGTLFTLKEKIDKTGCYLMQHGNYFEIPENLQQVKSTKFFIFDSLKKRIPVLSLDTDIQLNPEVIDRVLRTKLITIKALSYGQSHNSLAKNQALQRNWQFLFWYLLYYNKAR